MGNREPTTAFSGNNMHLLGFTINVHEMLLFEDNTVGSYFFGVRDNWDITHVKANVAPTRNSGNRKFNVAVALRVTIRRPPTRDAHAVGRLDEDMRETLRTLHCFPLQKAASTDMLILPNEDRSCTV